jgi:Holliday junction resolvase RusA-like endonuclease|tara:strand:+ start:7856 stop:8308 length:453 start_codon:yes stop_codon:yes gene_type:complete
MKDFIAFVVPGEPQPKERPRFVRRGNFVTTYTPKKTAEYEKRVAKYATEAGAEPHAGVHVELIIYASFPIPKSKPKWWKLAAESGLMPKTTKPDIDNVLKIVLDALNGVAFADDAQVIITRCHKHYRENPALHVEIRYGVIPTRNSLKDG